MEINSTDQARGVVCDRDKLLSEIQERVLWLAVNMVDYANHARPSSDGMKVGGHQASSSSVVTIMTSLYFDFMKSGDKISVKPHASPIFHSIQYLLGNLDVEYLKTLRGYHGLQAYPSRTKDPDSVDFSSGSVGLGAVAPNFAALVKEYIETHFSLDTRSSRRYISLVGDAELDEGSVWEAISEPAMADMPNVIWVVDLNRQSLDRVIPGIRVRAWTEMFRANGWNVVEAKYGKKLQLAFTEPNGEILKQAIDGMSNQMYQRLLRLPAGMLREWLPKTSVYTQDLRRLISYWSDQELQDLIRNLGGHDFSTLRESFAEVDLDKGPSVVLAYTLKGWMLPSVGDPQNHSVILSKQQLEQFREQLNIQTSDIWSGFEPDTSAGRLCIETKERLKEEQDEVRAGSSIPADFGRVYSGKISTQQVYGMVLTDLSRNLPEVSDRVVTLSPDVASSTNLGGWINKVGVWSRGLDETLPSEEISRSLNWKETAEGQHIELGLSENNLFLMLGQLGLTSEMEGELLYPVGTLYDPFVRRGMDAFFYSVYSGAKFIVVGTPSGSTLSSEGGSHQSMLTPSVGIEMPDLNSYEPCFGQEVEWILMDALDQIRLRKRSTYLRLSSKRIDQNIFNIPSDPHARERLRLQVLSGAYRLIDRRSESGYKPGKNVVHIMSCGVMTPEAVEASMLLLEDGVMANVINITGPGPLYEHFQQLVENTIKAKPQLSALMSDLIGEEECNAPIVTVIDGHPHSMAWMGAAFKTQVLPLGSTKFGQSGNMHEIYEEQGIDLSSIMGACFAALDLQD